MSTRRFVRNLLVCTFTCMFCVALVSQTPAPADAKATTAERRDGQHDFDFNFGTWETHIKRLRRLPDGSSNWIEMKGTVTVRKVWGGKAQLEEIEADGPSGHFEGLTLFLYNPEAHQWNQYFASSSDGTMDRPGVGEFSNGRGELY